MEARTRLFAGDATASNLNTYDRLLFLCRPHRRDTSAPPRPPTITSPAPASARAAGAGAKDDLPGEDAGPGDAGCITADDWSAPPVIWNAARPELPTLPSAPRSKTTMA